MSWILGVQHGLGPARPPTSLLPGGATRPPSAGVWVDTSGNTTIEGDLTVNGATVLVGGETFQGLVTVTSSTGAGAAGALGPEEMQLETTQAATVGATIRNPGYIDFEARTWETTGGTSTTQLFGRLGAVVDTITAATGVPATYRFVWTNTAGTIVTAFTQAGVVQVSDGDGSSPSYSFLSDPNTGFFSAGANRLGWAIDGVNRGEFLGAELRLYGGGSAGNDSDQLSLIGRVVGDAQRTIALLNETDAATDTYRLRINNNGGTQLLALESTGQLQCVSGTVTAPSLSLAGDTNTGFYSPAADTIGATAGGVLGTQWNPHSIASAAGAVADTISIPAQTVTITGATGITTATGFNLMNIGIPTMSAASALTIDNSATVYVAGAPVGGGGGPAAITNAYSLWIDAGLNRFDDGIQDRSLTQNGILYAAANGRLTSTAAATDGQLLIGDTGSNPILAGLTGTANQVTVTNGAGSITLSTPQDIATGSSPTFANVTLGTGGALRTNTLAGNTLLLQARDVDGAAYTTFATLTANDTPTMDLADGVTKAGAYIYRASGTDVAVADGGTGLSSWTANSLCYASATTTLASLGVATNGQIPIGSTAAAPVLATITATANQTSVTNGAGSITIGTVQDIATGSAPTFAGETLTGQINWSTGEAVTAGEYSVGRDADGTNQLHFNVPTGAGVEWSINDVSSMVFSSSGRLGIGTGTLALNNPFVVGGAGGANAGMEIAAEGTTTSLLSYNRNTSAYAGLSLDGSSISLSPSAVAGLTVNASLVSNFISTASAGAAGAYGPEQIKIQTTQAATAGATIRNPGYVDWEARTWETTGGTSTTQAFGRFGAVVDTITAATGVPATYRLAWANTAGTIQASITETGSPGFWATTPPTSRTTYTQTYSTADATHATPTVGADIGAFTDPPSAAEMATLRTFVNALKADHTDLAQLVNRLIDDLQAYGLAA